MAILVRVSRLASPRNDDWATNLYEDNASIYQPILEAGLKTAPGEAAGIAKLFRSNGVPRGCKVLDVACGIGRHSVFLAKAGYDVTGVDPSPTFLARANKLANDERVRERTRFIRGSFSSIRKVVPKEKAGFGGIIVMDGSIGVTAREKDDLALLKNLHALAAERSVLVLEIFDREAVARRYQWTMIQEFPRRLVRIWKSITPPGNVIHEAEWLFYKKQPDGSLKLLLTTKVRTRQYSISDLTELGEDAGWKLSACYGNIQELSKFAPTDYRAFLAFVKV